MRRVIILLVAVALVTALVIVTFVAFQRRAGRAVTLANGMRIELLGTSVGSASFTTEKSWQRFARKHLPSKLTQWIPPTISGNCSSGSNSVTVFVQVTDPNGTAISSTPWQAYVAEDDSGFRFPRGGGFCGFGSTTPGRQVYGLIVMAYPRRQPDFLFHLLGPNDARLGTLRVPNPVRGPFPIWQPLPLPQTQTNGPVELTLESLRAIGGGSSRSVKPRWHLMATDSAWARARAKQFTLLDATGNDAPWLSPKESAWNLRAFFYRDNLDDFPVSERLVFTNLAIPRPGAFVPLDKSLGFAGARIIAHVLAGAGTMHFTNRVDGSLTTAEGMRGISPPTGIDGGHSWSSSGSVTIESWGSANPFFLIEMQNEEPNDDLLFRLADEKGTEIKLSDSHTFDGLNGGGRMYRRGFAPPAGAQSLTLEVVVSRPLKFEFMVNPADVQMSPR